MKNTVTKVFAVVAMVAAIVGLVCIGVSMMDLGNRWALIAGQICVIIGVILNFAVSARKKIHKK